MNPLGEEVSIHPVPLTSLLSPDFDGSQIIKENLDLRSIAEDEKLSFLLHNVFSLDECEALINVSEETGYTDALVHIGDGKQVRVKGIRDGGRVLIDDREFVDRLLQRILSYMPATFKEEKLVEINERLRFLRYDQGDQFKPHCDCSYGRPDNSALTLINIHIYLNENFDGGATTFLQPSTNNRIPIVPKTGMILVFEHNILHEGSLVKQGRKYTIRTDVLYTRERYDQLKHHFILKK